MFKCFEAGMGKPLNSVGASNLLKLKSSDPWDATKAATGRNWCGQTFEEIFTGLKKDYDYKVSR